MSMSAACRVFILLSPAEWHCYFRWYDYEKPPTEFRTPASQQSAEVGLLSPKFISTIIHADSKDFSAIHCDSHIVMGDNIEQIAQNKMNPYLKLHYDTRKTSWEFRTYHEAGGGNYDTSGQ